MGVDRNTAKLLLFAKQKGVDFRQTLMLGRQQLYVTAQDVAELSTQFKQNEPGDRLNYTPGTFGEPFFSLLGAKRIESIDYSSFEKATVIHDMNTPLPHEMKSQFTVVFDGGTLEHVFNFPIAIKNCMNALTLNGHFISVTPTNNFCGHGFYQFSPELFFSLFSRRFGFEMIFAGVTTEEKGQTDRDWYQITDPHQLKRRVTIVNNRPTSLMVIAKKITDQEIDVLNPFQSDYEYIWSVQASMEGNTPMAGEGNALYIYRKYVPEVIKKIVRRLARPDGKNDLRVGDLGMGNPDFFKKLDI